MELCKASFQIGKFLRLSVLSIILTPALLLSSCGPSREDGSPGSQSAQEAEAEQKLQQQKQKNPFLYEVEKNGKISYILGSMHAGIPLKSYPDVVFELAEKLENTAFESDPEVFMSEHGESLKSAALYPEGESLDQKISAQSLAKLKELLDKGQGIDHLMKFKPWAISAEVSSDVLDKLKKEDTSGLWDVKKGIDNTLLGRAKEAGKSVILLDDASRKAQEFSEDTTVADLEKLLSRADPKAFILQCAFRAQELYLAGDESKFNSYNQLCETERFIKRVQERTIAWIAKLEPLFLEGDAFVVVGASHLNGPNGIVELMAAKGFRIRRLDANGKPNR